MAPILLDLNKYIFTNRNSVGNPKITYNKKVMFVKLNSNQLWPCSNRNVSTINCLTNNSAKQLNMLVGIKWWWNHN